MILNTMFQDNDRNDFEDSKKRFRSCDYCKINHLKCNDKKPVSL